MVPHEVHVCGVATPLRGPDILLAPSYACPRHLFNGIEQRMRTSLIAIVKVFASVSGTCIKQ